MLDGAKRIIELYDEDEFEIFVVTGKNGYGKTSYAHRLISEVYSKDGIHGNWDISTFKKRIGFHPAHVIKNWKDRRKRDYCFHWDDAGFFLNALDHQDPFVKEVGKYMQTARKKFGCIMFSCIDRTDIINKIRNFKSAIIIDITKEHTSPNSRYSSQRNTRKATAWHYWKDRLDKVGTENDWSEHFNSHVPDNFYAWYEPLRDQYTKAAEQSMWEKLRKKRDLMKTKSIVKI